MTPEEIQAIFFVECEESLAAAEVGLATCRDGTQDDDTVNAVFRAVHSIKGGAGAFGFAALQGFTHTFESLLGEVREGVLGLSDGLTALMLRALDTLSDHVTAARDGETPPDDAALLAELSAAQGGAAAEVPAAAAPAPEPTVAPAPDDPFDFDLGSMLDGITDEIGGGTDAAAGLGNWQFHLRPHAGAMRNGSEPLLMLRDLAASGATLPGLRSVAVAAAGPA